ncbi:MAG TPA: hypothetical protein VEP49_14440 [Acidimicrobiia bacterium]|nr:hypothetical protein [Acidimicrobiia bacterium]
MPSVRQLAEQLCRALRDFEPGAHSGEDCAEIAESLATTAKACETASARAAARAAEWGEHAKRGSASAAEWMARSAGSSTGQARAALDTLRRLATRPAVDEALRAGEVSLAQAAEIVSAPAESEAELLRLARTSGLARIRNQARKRRLAAMDPDELHAQQRAAREFFHWRDRLGMVRFRGALPPDVGVPFVNRLDRETDRVWRATRGTERTRAQCAADAFVHLVRTKGDRSRSPDLVIVTDLRAFRRGHAHEGELCHIIGGGPIPVGLVRELAKDSFLKAVLHDGVNIHTVTHFGRYRRAELETALMLGDPPDLDGVTCRELGCDRRYGLQWDHVDPLANGGVTSRRNLAAECTPHHDEKTERDRRAGRLGPRRRKRGPP